MRHVVVFTAVQYRTKLKIVPPLLALKIVGNICRRKGCASIVLVRIEQPIVGAEVTVRIASRGSTSQSATEIVNYQRGGSNDSRTRGGESLPSSHRC